ncbi:transcriptional regulator, LysR family [Polaromonas sp. YR568]|uniref:LysR family transcriptional regulator n=1 Tax=Polaromonas sp. YR568 TaxID=1855301 RepID=UPI0008DFC199|nr:LysR family transcriptional regulator [Polaromonas sp. YR568]SFU83692.1 transcriptional regulator, LysR family [Polaromonas sp. YR568]
MDLRQLSYFVAVAEELSFSRAAVRVHISQPPLSRQIAKLEEELGAVLLARSSHEVTLTPAGHALLDEARRLLAQAGGIKDVVARAQRGETGSLRIGFVGSTLYTSVPALLSRYRQLYPQVAVSVQQATVAKQTVMLKNGDIDIGIIRQPITDAKLVTRSLFKEDFMVALPAHHRLAGQQAVALKALADEDFVFFSRSEAPAIHEQLRRMCEAAGFSPRIVQEVYPMSTVVGLVAAGVGIAIVPESMQRLRMQHVLYRDLLGTKAKTEFFLAWRADNDSQTLKGFLEMKAA